MHFVSVKNKSKSDSLFVMVTIKLKDNFHLVYVSLSRIRVFCYLHHLLENQFVKLNTFQNISHMLLYLAIKQSNLKLKSCSTNVMQNFFFHTKIQHLLLHCTVCYDDDDTKRKIVIYG